ncbi:hypothetical protein ACFQJD_11900 [Haloplanus sp. GCM10025708]
MLLAATAVVLASVVGYYALSNVGDDAPGVASGDSPGEFRHMTK